MIASAFAALDTLLAGGDVRAQIDRAVGFYDCPCGSEFELFEDASLEDYASLNRWLGRHVNGCPDVELAEAIDREVGLYRAVEIDELRAENTSLRRERDDLIDKDIQTRELWCENQELRAELERAVSQLEAMKARMDGRLR